MRGSSQPELFDREHLVGRLYALGLQGVQEVECHDNQSVIVSVTPRGVLRIHRGFAYAPDGVLSSVVAFVKPGTRRNRRAAARRAILAFPADAYVGTKRRRRRRQPGIRPGDRPLLGRLANLHAELNARHFDDTLASLRFRISYRMQRRLGELTLDPDTDRPLEMSISHIHIVEDGWGEVEQTLLHEMIHQWQAENQLPVDHGAIFRRKARAVGVAPRAMRRVRRPNR